MLSTFKGVVAVALGAGFTLLAFQNTQAVTLAAYGLQFEGVPIYAVILIAGAVGAFPTLVMSWINRLRARSRMGKLRKLLAERETRITELEQELLRLRGVA